MKSIFKSKTAALSFITGAAGAVAFIYPPVGAFVAVNGPVILIGLSAVMGIVRLVTKKEVYLFPKK